MSLDSSQVDPARRAVCSFGLRLLDCWDCGLEFRRGHMSLDSSHVDSSGRAVCSFGLRLLACWDCGLEFRRGQWCLSLVSVVCCQVEISATVQSLNRMNPTVCVCACVITCNIGVYTSSEWPKPSPCASGNQTVEHVIYDCGKLNKKTNSGHFKRRPLTSKEKRVSEQIPKTDHPFYKLYWLWKYVIHQYVQTQWTNP